MKNIRLISSIIIVALLSCAVYLTLSSLNSTISVNEKKNIILIPEYAISLKRELNNKTCSRECFSKYENSKNLELVQKGSPLINEGNIFLLTIQTTSELKLLNNPLALLLAYFDFEEIKIWTEEGYLGNYKGGASVKEFIKIPIELKDKEELKVVLVTKKLPRNLLFFNSLVFIGGTSSLTNIFFHTEREKVTTPLLYIMLSITFIVIFILFQFLSKKEDLYWKQVLLALTSSISIFLTSYLPLSIIDQDNIFYYFILMRTLWSFLFIRIFIDIAKLRGLAFKISTYVVHLLIVAIVTHYQLLPSPEIRTFQVAFPLLLILPVLASLISVGIKLFTSIKNEKKGIYLTYITLTLGILFIASLFIATSSELEMIYYFDFFVLLGLVLNSILEFRLNERTIEKQNNQLIEQAQESAISFTAKVMAHDLRRPLSQISSILENINTYQKDPKLLSEITKEMNKNIDHSERLLSSLLDFSNSGSIEMSEASPEAIINEALSLLQSEVNEKGIEVSLALTHTNNVICNSPRIIRTLTNIIQNAIEIPSTRIIRISSENKEESILFKIMNNGSYIDEESSVKIFDAYHSAGKLNGTGLGLASCKKNLQLHEKEIYVTSNRDTAETTFYFELDLGSKISESIQGSSNMDQRSFSGGINILSCNDDLLTNINLEATFKSVISTHFNNITLNFIPFTSGEDLLHDISSYASALVLCDYDLRDGGGKINGLKTIECIEESTSSHNCYLMTGWDFSEEINVKRLSSKFLKEDCISIIESHLSFLNQRID